MKVSGITPENLANYLRLEFDELSQAEKDELEAFKKAALSYIKSHTGLDDLAVDKHDDFVIVVYILVEDMYDNRSLYVEKASLNKTVETILGMHSTNLL